MPSHYTLAALVFKLMLNLLFLKKKAKTNFQHIYLARLALANKKEIKVIKDLLVTGKLMDSPSSPKIGSQESSEQAKKCLSNALQKFHIS